MGPAEQEEGGSLYHSQSGVIEAGLHGDCKWVRRGSVAAPHCGQSCEQTSRRRGGQDGQDIPAQVSELLVDALESHVVCVCVCVCREEGVVKCVDGV